MIIAVGYRVNSYEATQFRIWAREVLKDFIIKGFVMDDERLKVSDADVLPNAGTVTHEEAGVKAHEEYEKFRIVQDQTLLSDFDKFIEGLPM